MKPKMSEYALRSCVPNYIHTTAVILKHGQTQIEALELLGLAS